MSPPGNGSANVMQQSVLGLTKGDNMQPFLQWEQLYAVMAVIYRKYMPSLQLYAIKGAVSKAYNHW